MDTEFFMSPVKEVRDIKLKFLLNEKLTGKHLLAYNFFKKLLKNAIYTELKIYHSNNIILLSNKENTNEWIVHKYLFDKCEKKFDIGYYRVLWIIKEMVNLISNKIFIEELTIAYDDKK